MLAVLVKKLSEVSELSGGTLPDLTPEEVELPPPAPGEVRVAIAACGLNFPDLLMIRGGYQYKPPLPFIPGMEISGVVEALGAGVETHRVGDAVVGGMHTGGFAEAINLPAALARPKPAPMSFAEAAAYPVATQTAYVGLACRGGLRAGETLLVLGASGGVGLAAVEMGKILGARVIGVARTEEKRRVVASVGADEVLGTENLRKEVKALTEGKGADVIYDPVGGDLFDEATRSIAWGGRLLTIGFASGRIPTLPVNLALIKGFSLVGVRAGEYGRRDPEAGAEAQAEIGRLAGAGKIRPHICATYPLAQARDALRILDEGKVIGKVVLLVQGK